MICSVKHTGCRAFEACAPFPHISITGAILSAESAMRYIKEEYDYISSIRRNNILFDMALYKLDQMIAEMKFNHTYDPYTVLTVPRIRAQIKLTDKYDPQFRTKK